MYRILTFDIDSMPWYREVDWTRIGRGAGVLDEDGGGGGWVRGRHPLMSGSFLSRLLLWRPSSLGDPPIGIFGCQQINIWPDNSGRASEVKVSDWRIVLLRIYLYHLTLSALRISGSQVNAFASILCLLPSLFSSLYDLPPIPPPRLPSTVALLLPLPRLPSNFPLITVWDKLSPLIMCPSHFFFLFFNVLE